MASSSSQNDSHNLPIVRRGSNGLVFRLKKSIRGRKPIESSSETYTEKFANEIKEMKDYQVIDVRALDTLSHDEALLIVKKVDEINKQYLRYMNSKLGSCRLKINVHKEIAAATNFAKINDPSDYTAQFELHRKRNEKENVRHQHNCTEYLRLRGYFIVDKSEIESEPRSLGMIESNIIEPHEVITKATEISQFHNENIIEVVRTNVIKLAQTTKSLTETIDTPTLSLSHCNVSNLVNKVQKKVYPVVPMENTRPKSMWGPESLS